VVARRGAVIVLALGVLTMGCSDDQAPKAAGTSSSTASSSTTSPTGAGLQTVDWENASVPASVCGGEGSVQLHAGVAVVSSSRWHDAWRGPTPSSVPSQVQISHRDDLGQVTYGDVDGDGGDEAVVGVWCDNGGGMAGGTLGQALVVFHGAATQPTVMGVLATTQSDPNADVNGVLPPYFDTAATKIGEGTITATELFYRPDDSTATPTGRAETTWTYDGSTLVRGEPHLTTEP
jgi:hypothetical protein